jgi:hypothetical protein
VWRTSNLWDSWSSLELAPLGPVGFWRFSRVPASLSTFLASFPHCILHPFWLMRRRTTTTCARYSLVFPWEKMDIVKLVQLESWILRLSGDSLVVTRSVRGMYRMGGRLLSCPFLHFESFSLSRLLRMVLILVCCQSVIPSTSLLKEDLGQACRNQTACVVLENFAKSKSFSSRLLLLPILHVRPVGWPGTVFFWLLTKCTAQ